MFPDLCLYLEWHDGVIYCKWWDRPIALSRCDFCSMFDPADGQHVPDDDAAEELDFGD